MGRRAADHGERVPTGDEKVDPLSVRKTDGRHSLPPRNAHFLGADSPCLWAILPSMQTTQQITEELERRVTERLVRELVTERLVREPERKSITGVSRAHWAREELAGRAPSRIHISERIVAWKLSELVRWVELTASGEGWSE